MIMIHDGEWWHWYLHFCSNSPSLFIGTLGRLASSWVLVLLEACGCSSWRFSVSSGSWLGQTFSKVEMGILILVDKKVVKALSLGVVCLPMHICVGAVHSMQGIEFSHSRARGWGLSSNKAPHGSGSKRVSCELTSC